MSRGARRDPRRRFLEVERTARPIDRDRHAGGEHDQHKEQIAHLLEQGHGEDVKADVIAERFLDDPERNAVEPLQVNVPAGGLALRREQGQHGRAARDDHAPRHAFAECANQFGQIDLDHLVRAPHDAQPLVIAARSDRNQPAYENGAERDQPHDQENRYLGADGSIENPGEAERAVPQVVDQQLIEEAQQQQRDDNDRRYGDEEITGPHQRDVLFATPDLDDVFPHHVWRAEPDEHFEREIADDQPVELADNRDHVELEGGRRQHEQRAHPRNRFRQHRDAVVGPQPIKETDELRQIHYEPAELHRPQELHAKYLREHRLPRQHHTLTHRVAEDVFRWGRFCYNSRD